MARRRVVNYLGNKELLKEIHKSKLSYCDIEDKKFGDYDIIVEGFDGIDAAFVEKSKENRADRLNTIEGDNLFADGKTNKQIEEYLKKHAILAKDIKKEDLVIRVLTNIHLPLVKNKKGIEVSAPVNFAPFQHIIWRNNKWECVLKSHFHKGEYNIVHGQVSRRLAWCYMEIVKRYSNKGNWRNYTWKEEMVGTALISLSRAGLQFAENKSNNPFAYFTTIITRAFTHVLNKEKEYISARNRMISDSGYNESFNNQAEHDYENYMRDHGPVLVKDD